MERALDTSVPRKSSDSRPLQPTTANITKKLPKLPTKTPSNTPTKTEEATIPPIPVLEPSVNKVNEIRPESPTLGPPVRTRSQKGKGKRGISPPPPSLSSARKRRVGMDVKELTEEGVEVRDKIGALIGVGKPEKRREAKISTEDKENQNAALVGSRSRDFDWDEDVF